MHTTEIKEMLYALGADLCGIASMDRLQDSPEGFHPCDVLPCCKSAIVFAKRFPAGTLLCNTTIPYTIVRNKLSEKMDDMAVEFCTDLERMGIVAVPTGTIGPVEFDERTQRTRAIVSAKHCAQAAGLGVIGKNTLLITPQYGNMVWLSVILTELELEADPLIARSYCDDCTLCIPVCPVQAIEEHHFNQSACWQHAFGAVGQGTWRIKCHKCRDICPFALGTENQGMHRQKI